MKLSFLKRFVLIKYFAFVVLVSGLCACTHPYLNDEPALDFGRYETVREWTETSTIEQIHQKMQQGQLTAVELTQFYLRQIKLKDSDLNSIIMLNPKALEIAKALDLEAKNQGFRGALHGIPVLLKDNIETKDMPTTAGSLALKDNHTHRDATLVKNLRDAGAIILGKTNLSEWANIRSERSSSGWSAIGGQTRNPHDTSRSACGSSSGSGAAIAANLAVAAVGTETDGSITCPAAMTGVVGFKPSVGVVSRFGIVPISETQDTAGPMAKHVADAVILVKAMASVDKKDSATAYLRTLLNNLDKESFSDAAIGATSIKQLKFGLMHSSATDHEAVAGIEEQLVQKLTEQEVVLKKDLVTTPYEGFWADSYSVLLFELKHSLNRYLADLPNELNQLTLGKLIQFNRQHKDQEMQYFQQEIFEKAEQKGNLKSQEYQEALSRVREETQTWLNTAIKSNDLDAIIAITRGPAWKIDKINGDNFNGGISTYAAVAGYPHITIPLDDVFGLPIGVSVIGLKGQDYKVLKIAEMLEGLIQNHY